MTSLSVRELNGNFSKALARVESGETVDITRNGNVIAELRPKSADRRRDPLWRASFEALKEDLEKGVPFGCRFHHDERNG
jgi:antitoxin (DNA-binding transcriptional repressor) of toxin-antitoxin stability system